MIPGYAVLCFESSWNRDFFLNIEKWNGYSGNLPEDSYVVYGGDESVKTTSGLLHSWNSIDTIGQDWRNRH